MPIIPELQRRRQIDLFLFYEYEHLSVYMYVFHIHVWYLWRLEDSISSQELEIQMVMSCYMGAGDWIQVLCKSHLCSPLPLFKCCYF